MTEHLYWLGFSLVQTLGPMRIRHLLNHFGRPEIAWRASENDLRTAGLEGKPLAMLLKRRSEIQLGREMEKIERAGVTLIAIEDEDYPPLLRQLPDAPLLLFVRGRLIASDGRSIAIVGTRGATAYGRNVAYKFAEQFAGHAITVVSGMALGVDTAAHEGALAGGGRTIAVLGCGVDKTYPRENAALAQKIIENGALISELPLGVPPHRLNFPRRNRILSGLAFGVLVAEAPEGSGAIITAEAALEQGREVFAVPSNIFNATGRGTNKLIQDGAKLVMRVNDILDELNIVETRTVTRKHAEHIVPANPTESALLQHLTADPLHVDELTRLSGLAVQVVTSTLTILELKGLAQMVGQMQYCRI